MPYELRIRRQLRMAKRVRCESHQSILWVPCGSEMIAKITTWEWISSLDHGENVSNRLIKMSKSFEPYMFTTAWRAVHWSHDSIREAETYVSMQLVVIRTNDGAAWYEHKIYAIDRRWFSDSCSRAHVLNKTLDELKSNLDQMFCRKCYPSLI